MTSLDLCEKLEEIAEQFTNDALDHHPKNPVSKILQGKAALIRQAIALLRREGMVWVPEEPTEEMRKAFNDAVKEGSAFWEFKDGYDAMIAAHTSKGEK